MSEVERLVTVIDLDESDSRCGSVSARHEAALADGRRFVLIDDRGWSGSAPIDRFTTKEVEGTARMVVGPDEPGNDQTREAVEGLPSSASSRRQASTSRMVSSERSHTTSS